VIKLHDKRTIVAIAFDSQHVFSMQALTSNGNMLWFWLINIMTEVTSPRVLAYIARHPELIDVVYQDGRVTVDAGIKRLCKQVDVDDAGKVALGSLALRGSFMDVLRPWLELRKDGNPNVVLANGDSLLMWALRRKDMDMFHWLMSLPGIDLDAASARGESVLDIAKSDRATWDARKWLNWHRRLAFAVSRDALVRCMDARKQKRLQETAANASPPSTGARSGHAILVLYVRRHVRQIASFL
jgi:hypothetical protein